VNALSAWAEAYVTSTSLAYKLQPPTPPEPGAPEPRPSKLPSPGRPPELTVTARSEKTPSAGALRAEGPRARLLHTFWHHELQAAELFCWALVAFPDTPEAFRRGLLKVFHDEVRHLGLYTQYLRDVGHPAGSFPVRDWFWQRVPAAREPSAFVATLGLGFEGANLDHAARFGERLAAAGDDAGASLQDTIRREEVAHVAFALKWFRVFTGEGTGGALFDRWAQALPEPLSPWVLRARPMNRDDRRRAGLDEVFLDRLEASGATRE
jgi:uncharacterized ferritin-like protein (DUF455 family)